MPQRQLTQKADCYWYMDKLQYIPDEGDLRKECMQMMHDHPFAGHMGEDKTKEQLSRLYWWPTWRKDVTTYVRECSTCQRNKPSNLKPAGTLRPLPIPGTLWESVGMDFITHLPKTRKGKTAILVCVDRLSKMVHFVATTDHASAEDVARLFIDNVVKHHGCPREITSDRDARFTWKFWQAFLDCLGIKSKMSTAFHPQTDGQTERANRVLQDMMHYVSPTHDDWDEHLTAAEFAVNNAHHASIGTTPFMLNGGQNPLTPPSLQMPKIDNPSALRVTSTLHERIACAKGYLEAAQDRAKAHADKGRREVHYEVGQEVLLSTQNVHLKGPGTPKLMPKWIGPSR